MHNYITKRNSEVHKSVSDDHVKREFDILEIFKRQKY
jgi:hypothetical protein